MAKCIKKGTTVKRVSDDQASIEVKQGWSYCPRSEWKKSSATHQKNTKRASTTEAVQESEETQESENDA